MITILHVVDLAAPNPWLNGIMTQHDRSRFRHLVVSVGPRCGLHEAIENRGGQADALDAPGYRRTLSAVWRLARLLRREAVDIVQTHLFHPTTVGLLAAAATHTPLRIVTRHHSDFTTIYNRPVHRRIDRWQALNADHVMAASHAVKRAMVRYEKVPDEKIVVCPYGYDFDELRPKLNDSERLALRRSLCPDDHALVTTVARLSIEKGHEYLIRGLVNVVRARPKLTVLFVGPGPLREQLGERVAKLGLQNVIKFLGWRNDAQRIMEVSDVMVHPTLHEAFCSVIIESMALERPLIATDVAAAPEQIDHDESGVIVPPRNPEALAAALLSLLDNPMRAAELGKEARRRVNERFNFPRMMRQYEHWYSLWYAERASRIRFGVPKVCN